MQVLWFFSFRVIWRLLEEFGRLSFAVVLSYSLLVVPRVGGASGSKEFLASLANSGYVTCVNLGDNGSGHSSST